MTETTSHLDLIREAVRNRKANNATLARNVGISAALLDSFSQGTADIPAENLDLIVDDIFHGFVRYDASADKLQSKPQPPARCMGTPPPILEGVTLQKFSLGPNPRPGPQPDDAAPVKPKSKTGRIGGWE